jgi:DNA polymerase V
MYETRVVEILGITDADGTEILPFFEVPVNAGTGNGIEDKIKGKLNLYDELVKHPKATFTVRVSGDSMTGANIFDGDLLIVDKSLVAEFGKIVVATINGETVVKTLEEKDGKAYLVSQNGTYKAIQITENSNIEIHGVVTSITHQI